MNSAIVSQRVEVCAQRSETRDLLDRGLTEFLMYCGFLAYPIPNVFLSREDLDVWLQGIHFDIVVFSGGDSIGSRPERDLIESWLIDYCVTSRIPLFGICRGMQVIAKYFGVDSTPVSHHVGQTHALSNRSVNSYHELGFCQVPSEFECIEATADGVIEQMRHKCLPITGIMWHPERCSMFDPRDRALISGMVD